MYSITLPCNLSAALEYAGMGYPIFPCRPREKLPLIKQWPRRATTDPKQLKRWWQRWPHANIGLHADGLIVVDVDCQDWPTDPEQAYSLLLGGVQRTPRGGRHYFFRQPIGKRWGNSQKKLADEVDTKSDGGYVLAAPSATERGEYHWVVELPPIDELPPPPDWLVSLLDQHCAPLQRAESGRPRDLSPTELLDARIAAAATRTLPKTEGVRNRQICALAGELKAIPELAKKPADELKPYLWRWYDQAKETARTKNFREYWKDFRYAWQRVGPKLSGVQWIKEKLADTPPPDGLPPALGPLEQRAAHICFALHHQAGGQDWYLSVRTLAHLLGISRMAACRLLHRLADMQVITRTEEGSAHNLRAAYYRWTL